MSVNPKRQVFDKEVAGIMVEVQPAYAFNKWSRGNS
jgi:hypothetical protein